MTRPTDPKFNRPLPRDTSPRAITYRFEKAYAESIGDALFESMDVLVAGRRRRMPRLEAYLHKLNQDCLKGDPSAIRERDKLIDFLREKNALWDPNDRPEPSEVTRRREQHERASEVEGRILSFAFHLAVIDLKLFYVLTHNELPPFEFSPPYYIDPEPGSIVWTKLASKRASTKVNSESGYKNPPVSHRFKKGQSGNPSGKSKKPIDVLDVLRSGLTQSVDVVKLGQKKRLRSAAITCTRVVERAIAGEKAARRNIREYLIELDRWGLMTPRQPQKRTRRPRKSPEKEQAFVDEWVAMINVRALELWPDMREDVVRVFGSQADAVHDDLLKQARDKRIKARLAYMSLE